MYCEICGEQLEVTKYEYNPHTHQITVFAYCKLCEHSEREIIAAENYRIQFTIIRKQDGSKKVRIDV